MSKTVILEKQLLDLYQERSFIEWMIKNLNGQQMSLLLVSCGIQINLSKSKNLHIAFLRNKLLIKPTRVKLVEIRIIPPFPYLLKAEGEESIWTEDQILEVADSNNIDDNDLALSLFLQNHHEAAMQLYEKNKLEEQLRTEDKDSNPSTTVIHEDSTKNQDNGNWTKDDVNFNKNMRKLDEVNELEEQKRTGNPPVVSVAEGNILQENDIRTAGEDKNLNKILKKLEQKIEVLITEKSTLLEDARNMKNETKETFRQQQKEIELLKQELAEKNKIINNNYMDTSALKIALESSLSSNELLKLKIKKLEPREPEMFAIEKKKVALLGNPKNHSVVTRKYLDIDVFALDTIQDYLIFKDAYDYVFYLSYTLDKVVFEKHIPLEDRQRIVQIENFLSLKKKMEELDHE